MRSIPSNPWVGRGEALTRTHPQLSTYALNTASRQCSRETMALFSSPCSRETIWHGWLSYQTARRVLPFIAFAKERDPERRRSRNDTIFWTIMSANNNLVLTCCLIICGLCFCRCACLLYSVRVVSCCRSSSSS